MTKKEAMDIIAPIVQNEISRLERTNCVYEERIKVKEKIERMSKALDVLSCVRK